MSRFLPCRFRCCAKERDPSSELTYICETVLYECSERQSMAQAFTGAGRASHERSGCRTGHESIEDRIGFAMMKLACLIVFQRPS